jgi:hypothetical protein
MRFTQIKKLLESEFLGEINMSPRGLRQLVQTIDARAGMEFEMIVPNVKADEEPDEEPDYDADQRTDSIQDICDFFHDGDFNGRRQIQNLREQLESEYFDWLSEQASSRFDDSDNTIVRNWVINNADDDEIRTALNLPEDTEIGKEQYAAFANYCLEEQNSYYDDAREDFVDDIMNEDLQDEWLSSEGLDTMSDVSNRYDITWPYYTRTGGDGEMDIATIADEFESAIGRKVNWSANYHGGRREPNTYVVEPDGSLDPDSDDDGGLEFVSPPLPIGELFADLGKIKEWAGRMGCYTNDSTGLHINVSVPGFDDSKMDYVKLALLLGDEYVLKEFGRMGNTYCKSALAIVKDRVVQHPEDAEAMLKQMRNHLSDMATKAIHSGVTHKYTSINTKSGYVEFRSPGGDWLGELAAGEGKIENTLLRFVVALDASIDPEKYRQEYLKKLYLLLQPKSQTDSMSYFVKYAAGELPKAALKSFIRQAQLERKVKKDPTGGEKYWWSVSRPGHFASIEVVARTKEEAIDKAIEPDNYPDWARARNTLQAKPIRPYDTSPVRATVGEPVPVGSSASGAWGVWVPSLDRYATEGGLPGPRRFMTHADAQAWIRDYNARHPGSDLELEVREIPGSSAAPAARTAYEIYNRENNNVVVAFMARNENEAITRLEAYRSSHTNATYDVRRAPADTVVPGSTTDLQQQRATPGAFTGSWKVTVDGEEVYRFSGAGNNQGDANSIGRNWVLSQIRQGTLQPVAGAEIEVLPIMS